MSLYGLIGYHVTLSEGHMIANQPIYGVIGYHVTLSEGHMLANHPLYKETLVLHLVTTLIYLSQIYSYYIRCDMSYLTCLICGVFKSVSVGMKCVLEHLGLSQHCLEAHRKWCILCCCSSQLSVQLVLPLIGRRRCTFSVKCDVNT